MFLDYSISYVKERVTIMHNFIEEWILCPICQNKTRAKIRQDTILKNYPLYCPKCKQESLIDVIELHITVIENNLNKN